MAAVEHFELLVALVRRSTMRPMRLNPLVELVLTLRWFRLMVVALVVQEEMGEVLVVVAVERFS